MQATNLQLGASYPRITFGDIPGFANRFVVIAEMRSGVYESDIGSLEPEETHRLRQAIRDGRGLCAALVPLLHKVLGWRRDMLPPGPEAPSLANRAPHSAALRDGQWGYDREKPAPPLSPAELAGSVTAPKLLKPRAPAMPPAELPGLADIAPDMPLTLAEACRLVFRDHIKPATLRAEARRGRLVMERVGRRDFVTLEALKEMRMRCRAALP